MDELISAKAEISKEGIPAWQFIPTGEFHVNGRNDDAHIGELFFADNTFRTGPAVQIRKWAFCMLRPVVDRSPDTEWIVAGFTRNTIHFFAEVHGDEALDARQRFCGYLVNTFWSLFHADYQPQPGDTFNISLRQVFPDPADVRRMVETFTLKGNC